MRTSRNFDDDTLSAYQIEPAEVRLNDLFGYKIIVVVDILGVRAYRGPTGWTDRQVALMGDEVSLDIVQQLFPTVVAAGQKLAESRRKHGG